MPSLQLKRGERCQQQRRYLPSQGTGVPWPQEDRTRASAHDGERVHSCTMTTTSTPQLPFKEPQIPSNRDHKALNRGTLQEAYKQDLSCLGSLQSAKGQMSFAMHFVPYASLSQGLQGHDVAGCCTSVWYHAFCEGCVPGRATMRLLRALIPSFFGP